MSAAAPSGAAALGRVVAGLVLVGLALRPQILMVGPLLPQLQLELGMSHGVAGLLGSIPVLCMGLLAPLGVILAGSVGPRLGTAICVLLIGGFGLLRAVVPDVPTILLTTVGVGAGMALVGPILPMVVRSRAARRPAAGTGAYVAGLIIGGSIAAAIAVPISDAFGGWRWSFGLISAAAGASLAAWWWLIPPDARAGRKTPSWPRLPWRNPSAWLLGLVFGSQSMLFYGSISWLASAYVERGWSAGQAAGLIALFNSVGLLASLAVPLLADRFGTRRRQLAGSALVALAGIAVIALTPSEPPGSPVALGAAAFLGIGLGAFFPLSLTLPVDVARDGAEAASIAALMLLVGYLISSLSPVLLGLVRDATGSFGAVLWGLVAMAVAMIPISLSLGERRLHRARGQ